MTNLNEINIYINNKKYTADDLIVYVYPEYKDILETINFNNTEELSKFLMHMNSLEEAKSRNHYTEVESCKRGIKWFTLNRKKEAL